MRGTDIMMIGWCNHSINKRTQHLGKPDFAPLRQWLAHNTSVEKAPSGWSETCCWCGPDHGQVAICGAEDDVEHRLWVRPSTEDIRGGLGEVYRGYMVGTECAEEKLCGRFRVPRRRGPPENIEAVIYGVTS